MNVKQVAAVIFDLGGTLEEVIIDPEVRRKAVPGFRAAALSRGISLTGSNASLLGKLEKGMLAYKQWKERYMIELSPEMVFSRFIFPEEFFPSFQSDAWDELALYFETNFYRRYMRPEVPRVLEELAERGVHIALISNIITKSYVHQQLEAYGISSYFSVVATSAECRKRKPDPLMFRETARKLGVPVELAMYVGDTISRDIAGAKRSGYGVTVQIASQMTAFSDDGYDRCQPDLQIDHLDELLDHIPGGTDK